MSAENRIEETIIESTLLKYPEAAAYLKVSHSTLYRMVAGGRLPVVRLGAGPQGKGITRFRRQDLDAFVGCAQASVA